MKIGYKLITAIIAVLVIAVLITAPFARIACESTLVQIIGAIGQVKENDAINETIKNNDGELPQYLKEEIRVMDFLDPDGDTIVSVIVTAVDNFTDDETKNPELEKLVAPAITMVVCAVLIVACAIAMVVVAFTKNNRRVIYAAISGIGASLMFTYTFSAITYPFVNGDLSFASVFQSSLASFIAKIVVFETAPSFYMVPVLFAVAILFTVLYNFTLPEKEKKARKEMLGEAE